MSDTDLKTAEDIEARIALLKNYVFCEHMAEKTNFDYIKRTEAEIEKLEELLKGM